MTHSIHDHYIKNTLSDLDIARDFLIHNLPQDLQEKIDLNTISMLSESFINEKIDLQIVDLLYEFKLKERKSKGFIYVLVEHASTPDPLLPFRMLKYTTAAMDRLKQGNVLPFVYPIVIHASKRSVKYSTDIMDMFGENKDLARMYMFKPYKLLDLNLEDDEALILQYQLFHVAALAAKHIRTKDFMCVLQKFIPLFNIK